MYWRPGVVVVVNFSSGAIRKSLLAAPLFRPWMASTLVPATSRLRNAVRSTFSNTWPRLLARSDAAAALNASGVPGVPPAFLRATSVPFR